MPEEILQKRTINPHERAFLSTVNPQVLNKTNSGYGPKQSQNKWNVALTHVLGGSMMGTYFEGINDFYESGEYSRVIANSLKRLKVFKSIDDLKKMNEADLANFYFLGMSYLELGEINKAMSCFHIVLSQYWFIENMLSGFPSYIGSALYQLEKLTEHQGEEYVNNNDPNLFLQQKKGGGCFIATAVYGDEYAHDIITLKIFRDRILFSTPAGRVFIKLYYCVSPSMGKMLQKHPKVSILIRNFAIHPIAIRIRSRFLIGNE